MEHLVKVTLQIVSRFVTTGGETGAMQHQCFRDTIVSHCSSPRVKRKALIRSMIVKGKYEE